MQRILSSLWALKDFPLIRFLPWFKLVLLCWNKIPKLRYKSYWHGRNIAHGCIICYSVYLFRHQKQGDREEKAETHKMTVSTRGTLQIFAGMCWNREKCKPFDSYVQLLSRYKYVNLGNRKGNWEARRGRREASSKRTKMATKIL